MTKKLLIYLILTVVLIVLFIASYICFYNLITAQDMSLRDNLTTKPSQSLPAQAGLAETATQQDKNNLPIKQEEPALPTQPSGLPTEEEKTAIPAMTTTLSSENQDQSEEESKADEEKIKEYKQVITTLFWAGERADSSNAYISNKESFWDSKWQEHFGGVDDPDNRCGYRPCDFLPKENPFYFALPYGDFNDDGTEKDSIAQIPWYEEKSPEESILKNQWIEIVYQGKTCYGQWEDVGPFEIDDFDYVFSNSPPKNTLGVGAGLDVSPAIWDYLGLENNEVTKWRFVKEEEVPPGPWKEIITRSGIN